MTIPKYYIAEIISIIYFRFRQNHDFKVATNHASMKHCFGDCMIGNRTVFISISTIAREQKCKSSIGGSVAVVVSTLASMVIEVFSCDIVEIVSLYFV